MWITTPTGRITLTWEHVVPYSTTCIIIDEDGYILAVGEAKCSESDQFCRETGRKVSLTRALEDRELFPLEARRAIWTQYLHRKETR